MRGPQEEKKNELPGPRGPTGQEISIAVLFISNSEPVLSGSLRGSGGAAGDRNESR